MGRIADELVGLGLNDYSVLFVTEEGHLGRLYHPEPLTAVQPGDVVVGLFGLNYPFVLQPLKKGTDREQMYIMVNLAYIVDHQYAHDFIGNASPVATWDDFEEFGSHEYIIV